MSPSKTIAVLGLVAGILLWQHHGFPGKEKIPKLTELRQKTEESVVAVENWAKSDPLPETAVEGRIVGVTDGDTVKLVVIGTSGSPEELKIRLNAIDAPESKQAFGAKAKERLSDLCFGKAVMMVPKEKDRYGRTIGTIYLNNEDINLRMVKEGFAWHYKAYDKTIPYTEAERDAKAKKKGLWADPAPTPPWDFRKSR